MLPLCLCVSVVQVLSGCKKSNTIPDQELPPGIVKIEGVFEDIGPRWSHKGDRIAFLRHTTDRKYQLCTATANLSNVTPLLLPEIINPDRIYRTERGNYRTPESLAWSPDDRYILFSRVEWMTFPDGDKLPGTAIWQYDTVTRATSPVAIHPPKYSGSLYHFRSPAISPDGRHIAFVGEGLHGETALFVRSLGPSRPDANEPRYDSYQDIGWPVWSPDGKLLAFRQGVLRGYTADPIESIRIIEPGGIRSRRAWATTPERYDALVPGTQVVQPMNLQGSGRSMPKVAGLCWSQTGSQLAFSVAGDARDLRTNAVWTLDLNKPNTGTLVTGSSTSGGYAAPVWIDDKNLSAIAIANDGKLSLAALPVPSNLRSMELPSTDIDWSPDRTKVVVAGPPTVLKKGPAPLTTLQLFTIPK